MRDKNYNWKVLHHSDKNYRIVFVWGEKKNPGKNIKNVVKSVHP